MVDAIRMDMRGRQRLNSLFWCGECRKRKAAGSGGLEPAACCAPERRGGESPGRKTDVLRQASRTDQCNERFTADELTTINWRSAAEK
jgi:hypothetical protein